MSFPTAVFLDTNVYRQQQYNFGSTAFSAFVPLMKAHSLKLLLPDPIEKEMRRQMQERTREVLTDLEEIRKTAAFLSKWKHFPERPTSTPLTAHRIAIEALNIFLAQMETIRLGYEGIDLARIMQWYDSVTAPFEEGKKRKEFPDAIAIASIEAYAKRTGEIVAVVSDDLGVKKACDRFSSMLYFRSLAAITEHLLGTEEEIERIAKAVSEDLGVLSQEAFDIGSEMPFRHQDRSIEVGGVDVLDARIHEVKILGVGSGECTLSFTGELEARFRLRWEDYDQGRNDYYVEETHESESMPFGGTAKVTLSTAGTMEKVVTFEFDEFDWEVSVRARRRW